jgi:hypothetical protein
MFLFNFILPSCLQKHTFSFRGAAEQVRSTHALTSEKSASGYRRGKPKWDSGSDSVCNLDIKKRHESFEKKVHW